MSSYSEEYKRALRGKGGTACKYKYNRQERWARAKFFLFYALILFIAYKSMLNISIEAGEGVLSFLLVAMVVGYLHGYRNARVDVFSEHAERKAMRKEADERRKTREPESHEAN